MIKAKKSNYTELKKSNGVLVELNRLPTTYYIFGDIVLSLYRPVKYKKTEEYVKFCQLDFLVVGPTGIFVIEAKERSQKILREASCLPLKETDKAGLIFYIRMLNKFHRKFPIYNVAVMLQKVTKVSYEYVRHLTLRELYWFILRRERFVPKRKITKITRWLTKISNRKVLKR